MPGEQPPALLVEELGVEAGCLELAQVLLGEPFIGG